MPNVWVVRADGGQYTQACVDGGFTGIGWEDVGDLTDVADKAQLSTIYAAQAQPEEGKGTIDTNVSTIWRFLDAIKARDWIITPAQRRRDLRYGKVVGDYCWVAEPDGSIIPRHRRDVEWSAGVLDRHSLSLAFQYTLYSPLTVFNVRHVNEFLEKIGEPVPISQTVVSPSERTKPYELAIERILTLSPTDFEHLVGYLLTAIGFDIEVTRPVADGGVDFRGTLNVSNAAQINITGQVKRYQRGSKITARPIRDLRGRIPIGEQGTFVTTSDYTKDARSVAEQDGFARVGLINGEQLVDLLTQHWPDIPPEFRDALGLKPILVPA